MPRASHINRLTAYVWTICLGGVLALATMVALAHDGLIQHASASVAALALLAVVGEMVPIRVFRRGAEGEVTLSTAFAFAALLDGGPLAGVIALCLASLVADVRARKPAQRVWFNASQYGISMAAAGGVLSLLTDVPHHGATAFSPNELPVIVLVGCIFFLVNSVLVAIVIALAHGYPIAAFFRTDLAFVAASAGIALGIGPIAALSARFSLALLPALALPLAGVHRAARQALELEHQSRHDALTGLPNRILLHGRLEEAVRLARRDEERVTVLLLDLDHFKEINDTLGHLQGDLLLREIAGRLRDGVRAGDVVARLGGDEFAILLDGSVETPHAARLARELLLTLEEPVRVEGVSLHVEGSIGIAEFPDHGTDVDTLLRRADIAMYVAKRAKTGVEVYDARHERNSPAELGLAGELHRALERGELIVHFQPEADLATGRVIGAEALARWEHPRHGLLAPERFIPLAENTGLIGPLTMTVLDQALSQLVVWEAAGHTLTVAVNLSTRSLIDRGLAARVAARLQRYGVAPERLELEITESMVAADPVRSARTLQELRDLGVRLALDDFGTGSSSLTNLRDTPVTSVKIDKSFILGMGESPRDAAIVGATIDLAHRLGLRVIAEGVETVGSWRRVQELDCDVAQGHVLAAAMPGDELVAWLDDHAPHLAPLRTCGAA